MHAVIFTSTGADESLDAAKAYAKGLNCINNKTDVPLHEPVSCGGCVSCRTFDSGNHPDTIYVTGSKPKSIGVDDVRDQIVSPMAYKPFKYKYKVFITDKAENLTPVAQNALLMTIEEPASYGVFLFSAKNIHAFLPTVLSRSVVVKCEKGTVKVDQGLKSVADRLIEKAANADIYGAFMLHKEFAAIEKENLSTLLDLIYTGYGEKIRAAATTGIKPERHWLQGANAVKKAKTELASNGNQQLALELMLQHMRGA